MTAMDDWESPVAILSVSQDADGWHVLLYNFRLGRWEEKSFVSR
jgi:hypothetical protein